MKYPRLANWYAPNAVHDWLRNELELRGIDSSVYTRYVLSMLSDDEDEDGSANNSRPQSNASKQRKKCSKQANNKNLHRKYQGTNWSNAVEMCCDRDEYATPEARKDAVVSCLQNASEENVDIKSLIDELDARLKRAKFQNYDASKIQQSASDHGPKQSSPRDKAKLYFDTFPALSLKAKRASVRGDGSLKKHLLTEKSKSWNGQHIIETTKQTFQEDILDCWEELMGASVFQDDVVKLNFVHEISSIPSFDEYGSAETKCQEENFKDLFSKFNSEVASIWNSETKNLEKPSSFDVWGVNFPAPTSETWSTEKTPTETFFGATGEKPLSVKFSSVTTLTNHGENSLFVKVSPKPKQYPSDVLPIGKIYMQHKGIDHLLTTAQTHFQPIRQDYYEKQVGIVIDPNIIGMVPCSSKCPNRKNVVGKEETVVRSKSPSIVELSSYIGPFPEGETDDEINGQAESACIADLFEKASDCSDKSTNTDSGNVENQFIEEDWEKVVLEGDNENQSSDYDALCSLLDEVLQKQKETALTSENIHSNIVDLRQLSTNMSFHAAHDANDPTLTNLPSTEVTTLEDENGATSDYDGDGYDAYYEGREWSDGQLNYEHGEDGMNQEDWNSVDDSMYTGLSHANSSGYLANDDVPWPEPGETFKNTERRTKLGELSSCGFQLQKPCSFFLEGNCRRSDCKFSHDLRRITCKFWEEGSCFKGESCPFLHGYDLEFGFGDVSKKKPSFTINSEQDFPSLAVNEFPELGSNSEVSVKGKREKQILTRMVGKKRKKGNSQRCNEKAV
ncbi:Uncharacterized protein HDE_02464 [Halotydeus destructor]|nr:Uncharacterized protein HDE_02464 [Halotydeus destructor]